MKIIKELSITDFKLLPSAKPVLFHGSTVRKTVTDHFGEKNCALSYWNSKEQSAPFANGHRNLTKK